MNPTTAMSNIRYPIFRLGPNKPNFENGVSFYYYCKDTEEGERITIRIIDDTNVAGDDLGRRRLNLLMEGTKLFRITNAIYFIGDLVKMAKPGVWFIDSNGKVFNYTKTIKARLRFHPIKQLLRTKGGGVIVESTDLPTRFKALYMPPNDVKYIGVLHWKQSLILYGFYHEKHKETWRHI